MACLYHMYMEGYHVYVIMLIYNVYDDIFVIYGMFLYIMVACCIYYGAIWGYFDIYHVYQDRFSIYGVYIG